ncbi:MAG: helix-turn-helix transcriptional regulator [Pseudomonadota bacterium]
MTGDQLKSWRIKNQVQQKSLARALGYSTVQIGKYENNRAEIPQHIVWALIGIKKFIDSDPSFTSLPAVPPEHMLLDRGELFGGYIENTL